MPLNITIEHLLVYLCSHTHANHCSLCPYLDPNLDQSLLNGYYGHFGVSLAGGRLDIEEKVIMKQENIFSFNTWPFQNTHVCGVTLIPLSYDCFSKFNLLK